jgi:hypothetical protein
MDARGGRATSGAARIENGQTFDRPEIKTDRVSIAKRRDILNKRGMVEIGVKVKK